MFIMNQVLKGTAFNGYDGDITHKHPDHFNDPASFKSLYDSRRYFFTKLLETILERHDIDAGKSIGFSLLKIYFKIAY